MKGQLFELRVHLDWILLLKKVKFFYLGCVRGKIVVRENAGRKAKRFVFVFKI